MSRFLAFVLYAGIALISVFAAIFLVAAVTGVIVTIFFPMHPGLFRS